MDMAEEDIQKLYTEIESLRKENKQLKIAAFQYLENQKNGVPEESVVLEKEPILKILSKQLDSLKQLNSQIENTLAGYQEVQRSLGAILPALELQMEGWTNEVQNLKKHVEDSESAYATVVRQLENKLKKTKSQLMEGTRSTDQRLREELEFYKGELRKYERQSPQKEDSDKEDPFTDLNIFGA